MVLIDDRVGSVELAPYISSPKCICRLQYADFAFTGSGPDGEVLVGVERKGLMDLLQSMTSGRLSGHQLIGLKQEYDWVYLVVEGVWKPDRDTGVLLKPVGKKWGAVNQGSRRFMVREVYNFIQSMQILCGVVVVQTGSRVETGKWLDAAYNWWAKPWDKHKSHLQFHAPKQFASLQKPTLVTRIAAQLDGVGWDKARKIGKRFWNVETLVDATESEFREIEGIGEKTAASIYEQLHC